MTRKYFLSATEAEIEEGIVPYINPTAYQKRLLQENPELEKVDPEHIFGFFRDIDTESQSADKFVGDDYAEAQSLKKRVRNELVEKNILHIKTKQVDSEQLDEAYLEEFREKTIAFLETKVDIQIAKEQSITPLQEELQAQAYFAQEKRKNFIGQEGLLKIIDEYIGNDDTRPLVIYGESGRGKSALMAQAVKNAETRNIDKVLYRFVGATANSGSSKEILTSLFEELGKDIRNEQDKVPKKDDISLVNLENQETFEQFSYRAYDEMMKIEDEIVIFIDAVDQLSNSDQFLWLPNKLPSNVKIITSALDDAKYSDDSQYFQVLKNKSDNIHKIVEFNDPTKLLFALLKDENRTIQKHQEEYFLKQYQKAQSPLYVTVAVQELKNWKSFDGVVGNDTGFTGHTQDLADTQQGIIEEFINNLSEFYHHDKRLVQKVLGYIYASRDGLSEGEILQLLSVDTEFVEQVAPNTWHENQSGGLPLVLWARLYTQLKPFLSKKTQDGEELLYFFHREFEDIVGSSKDRQKVHASVIKFTQKLILKYQYNNFYSNRWGKIYIKMIVEFSNIYKSHLKEYSKFPARLNDIMWKSKYILYLYNLGVYYLKQNDYRFKKYIQSGYYTANVLYKETSIEEKITSAIYSSENMWFKNYLALLNIMAIAERKIGHTKRAIVLNKEFLKILEIPYFDNPKKWEIDYSTILNNLGNSYDDDKNFIQAIYYFEKSLKIIKQHDNDIEWLENQILTTHNLAQSYSLADRLEDAIHLEKTNLITLEKNSKNILLWEKYYYKILDNLGGCYLKNNEIQKAIKTRESCLPFLKKKYLIDSEKWLEDYTAFLYNLSNAYSKINKRQKSIELLEEAVHNLEPKYLEFPSKWIKLYESILHNLTVSYIDIKNYDQAIKYGNNHYRTIKIFFKINGDRINE